MPTGGDGRTSRPADFTGRDRRKGDRDRLLSRSRLLVSPPVAAGQYRFAIRTSGRVTGPYRSLCNELWKGTKGWMAVFRSGRESVVSAGVGIPASVLFPHAVYEHRGEMLVLAWGLAGRACRSGWSSIPDRGRLYGRKRPTSRHCSADAACFVERSKRLRKESRAKQSTEPGQVHLWDLMIGYPMAGLLGIGGAIVLSE